MNSLELLIDITSNTNALIRYEASRFNLTISQAFHLLLIPFDGISMSTLAKKLGLDTSTLTRNIQKLENIGFVMRRPDLYDKRINRILLTNDGSSLVISLEERLEERYQLVSQNIDLDTQEHLQTVLEKLAWALECTRQKS